MYCNTASTMLPLTRPLASATVGTYALFMCVLVEYRTQLYPGRAEAEERSRGVRPASAGRSCKVHLRVGEGHGLAPVVGNSLFFCIPAHCFQRRGPGGTGIGNPAVGVSTRVRERGAYTKVDFILNCISVFMHVLHVEHVLPCLFSSPHRLWMRDVSLVHHTCPIVHLEYC